MYRCSHYPCDKEIFQKYVSKEMADFILCVFGPIDEEGHFKSLDRVREFMKRSEYLNELVEKKIKTNDGVLGEEVYWEDIVKARYENIYMKLIDPKHEYTFNEFGEGLINLLFEFYGNARTSYLVAYEDNKHRFEDEGIWVNFLDKNSGIENPETCENPFEGYYFGYFPFHDRECREELSLLRKALEKGAEDYYNDVIYDMYYDEDLDEISVFAPSREEVSDAYCEHWENVVNNLTCYSYDGINENYEYYWSKDSYNEDIDFTMHFIYWDDDFYFVLSNLHNKKNLDSILKTIGIYLNYNLKSANDIFSDCDGCYPI